MQRVDCQQSVWSGDRRSERRIPLAPVPSHHISFQQWTVDIYVSWKERVSCIIYTDEKKEGKRVWLVNLEWNYFHTHFSFHDIYHVY